jgi:prevent-host-death family protein
MTVMNASEARAALPEILDRVLDGEEITITRHGQPVAVVVRPDRLRARRADGALAAAERVRDLLDTARSRPLRTHPSLSAERADELVAYLRSSRSGR